MQVTLPESSKLKKVIELIRVSTEGQAAEDRGGIPAQKAANRRTAGQFGLQIVKTIEIIDVSGASVLESPEMKELLSLIKDPEIHGVVAREFSRVMRPDNFNDYILLQHFIETGTLLYLPEGPIDLTSISGRFFGTIRAAMAGLERREILERMRAGKEALRRAGRHPGGHTTLPYGVTYSKEKGWAYNDEAEKVKQAFALVLSGNLNYAEIGRRLNLPRSNLQYILQNPIYTGWRIYDEKRDPSSQGYWPRPDGRQGDRRKIKRVPDDVISVKVLDGLVSTEDFARVQRYMELKRKKHWRARNETTSHYTYNGFLICGDKACGSLIYTQTSVYDFYYCSSRHPREKRRRALSGLTPCTNRYMLRKKLEPKVDYLLGRKLIEPEFLMPLVEKYNERFYARESSPTIDARKVNARLRQLGDKRERVLETYYEGVISKEERVRRVELIDREINAYQNLLMEEACVQPGLKPLDMDAVRAIIEPFSEWEFLGREDKRRLLALLCPEITVYRYQIRGLTLNFANLGTGGDEPSRRRMGRSASHARPCR